MAARTFPWEFDWPAIAAAIDALGIRCPVRISRRPSRQHWGVAYHDGVAGEVVRHRVSLDSGMSAAQASRTLWHELAHCEQTERPGGLARVSLHNRTLPYDARPHEIEAREASDFADDYPLVIARATHRSYPFDYAEDGELSVRPSR